MAEIGKPVVTLVDARRDPRAAAEAAVEAAGWRDRIPAGADVALKPNLGWDLFLPGAVTSPRVVEGVIRAIRKRAGRIYLVEADQVLVNIERALQQTRMVELCRRYDVEWVNLSRQPFVRVPVKDPLALDALELPEILTRTRLVTIPVMKTHGKTTISGAIKNQWGCLPTFRHNFHPVVNEVLRDLATVLRPDLTVMDATVALEGNGPKSGRPRICNLVLSGADPVAVDAVAARIMGLDPLSIRHLAVCQEAGIGCREPDAIDVRDEQGRPMPELPRLAFQTARQNTVASVETLLRSGPARRLVFETPLLQPFCWGARVWYAVWYHVLMGRRRRDRVLADYPHADQWR